MGKVSRYKITHHLIGFLTVVYWRFGSWFTSLLCWLGFHEDWPYNDEGIEPDWGRPRCNWCHGRTREAGWEIVARRFWRFRIRVVFIFFCLDVLLILYLVVTPLIDMGLTALVLYLLGE